VSEDWTINYFNYFTEIEEHFQRARGTSLFLLSPLDWALIEAWKNAGVPLAAVLRGIDSAFDKWRSRKVRTQMVNSLAFCAQAVLAEAQAMGHDLAVACRRWYSGLAANNAPLATRLTHPVAGSRRDRACLLIWRKNSARPVVPGLAALQQCHGRRPPEGRRGERGRASRRQGPVPRRSQSRSSATVIGRRVASEWRSSASSVASRVAMSLRPWASR